METGSRVGSSVLELFFLSVLFDSVVELFGCCATVILLRGG